jgi:hypothetical protein
MVSFERVGKLGTLRTLVDRRFAAQNVAAPTPEQYNTELQKLRDDFKKAGTTELTVVQPWEIVCAELCGQGHSQMKGELIVLSGQQYINFIHKDNPPTSPTTQPTTPASSSTLTSDTGSVPVSIPNPTVTTAPMATHTA